MQKHLEPTQESGAAVFSNDTGGEVVMLNVLRFREVADYSEFPDLAPEKPISGQEAYQIYMAHTSSFLAASGGSLQFMGTGGNYLIGPLEEKWDMILLVRHKSLIIFREFANNQDYLAGMGHRTAALEDSRSLPIVEVKR